MKRRRKKRDQPVMVCFGGVVFFFLGMGLVGWLVGCCCSGE